MKEFSPEDLLEYHYGEMDAATCQLLEERLQSDWTLREKLVVISEAALQLNKALESPRKKAIDFIVGYAEGKQHHSATI